MFVQFGYVVLFSSAFPLAALCALVNNLIEIRSDALKLCTGLQRPFGQRVESIGQWQVWGRPRTLSRGPEGVRVRWGGAGGPGKGRLDPTGAPPPPPRVFPCRR